jgi:hypothetical protein
MNGKSEYFAHHDRFYRPLPCPDYRPRGAHNGARVNEFRLLGEVMRENQRNRQSAATWPRV